MPISQVHNCDCLEYMRSLPDDFFSLAIADPPYGGAGNQQFEGGQVRTTLRQIQVNHAFGGRFARYNALGQEGRGQKNTMCGGVISWDIAPCEEWFDELYRVSKNQIIWGANYFPNMPATRCFIVWEKLSISESFSMAMAEYAWTSFNGNAKLYKQTPQGTKGDRFHPTQKPIELYAWTLKNFAKQGDTIFDPMMGSQSSRIAAYKLGFDYVGCELNKDYFEAGNARFDKHCNGIEVVGNRVYKQQSLF